MSTWPIHGKACSNHFGSPIRKGARYTCLVKLWPYQSPHAHKKWLLILHVCLKWECSRCSHYNNTTQMYIVTQPLRCTIGPPCNPPHECNVVDNHICKQCQFCPWTFTRWEKYFFVPTIFCVELHNVNHLIQAWIPTLPPPPPQFELLYKTTQVYIKLK